MVASLINKSRLLFLPLNGSSLAVHYTLSVDISSILIVLVWKIICSFWNYMCNNLWCNDPELRRWLLCTMCHSWGSPVRDALWSSQGRKQLGWSSHHFLCSQHFWHSFCFPRTTWSGWQRPSEQRGPRTEVKGCHWPVQWFTAAALRLFGEQYYLTSTHPNINTQEED